jgi:hypothetical protein
MLALLAPLLSPAIAYAQDWVDDVTGRVERQDFTAEAPLKPNRYLLPDNVGPARRFDFSATAAYQRPKDLPPDFDPNAPTKKPQINPGGPPPQGPPAPARESQRQ